MTTHRGTHRRPSARGGFTLTELLIVIAVLSVLAVLTAISVVRISRQSRVASAVNTVTNMLGAARGFAIKENTVIVVAFRPVWDSTNKQKPQQTEVVVAKWSGESNYFGTGTPASVADRYVLVDQFQPTRLPAGIKVAGPLYEFGVDNVWVTQGDMAAMANNCSEAMDYSRMVAVMFSPDGTMVTRNPRSSAGDAKSYIDFNMVNFFNEGANDFDAQDVNYGGCHNGAFQQFWSQDDVRDEPNLSLVPFLAVFDDRAVREHKQLDWGGTSGAANMLLELCGPAGFITTNADRVHFNRYTGVAETRGQDQ